MNAGEFHYYCPLNVFFFFFKLDYLIFNVVVVSAALQSESLHVYLCPLLLFHSFPI